MKRLERNFSDYGPPLPSFDSRMTNLKLKTCLAMIIVLWLVVQKSLQLKSNKEADGDFKFLTGDYVKYLSKENVALDVSEMLEIIDKFIVKLNKNKYLAVEEIENEIEFAFFACCG